jgi:hypothetical protein
MRVTTQIIIKQHARYDQIRPFLFLIFLSFLFDYFTKHWRIYITRYKGRTTRRSRNATNGYTQATFLIWPMIFH